jgi:tRNA1(Val) A37 N6-methylase TrmN6
MKLRSVPESQSSETTDDAILGGRLRLFQPRHGHRVGHDAVLLAAATGAQTNNQVVDLGAGVGAAGLALALRVSGAAVTLVERDAALMVLCVENIERNGLGARARAALLDVTAPRELFAAAGLGLGSADRVMMNPPFNDPAQMNVSPDPQRSAAHAAATASLSDWIGAASWLLHSAGTLTMIWRADGLAEVLAALPPHFGGIAILPVYGRAGQSAIRVIVRASKARRSPFSLLPGLVLNDTDGHPTAQAERVLRNAETLPLAEI